MVVKKGSLKIGAIVLGCLEGMIERTIYSRSLSEQ